MVRDQSSVFHYCIIPQVFKISYRVYLLENLWAKTVRNIFSVTVMDVKQTTIVGRRDFSKQVGSRRIYLFRRTKDNIALSWLVLLSMTISSVAEVSSHIYSHSGKFVLDLKKKQQQRSNRFSNVALRATVCYRLTKNLRAYFTKISLTNVEKSHYQWKSCNILRNGNESENKLLQIKCEDVSVKWLV